MPRHGGRPDDARIVVDLAADGLPHLGDPAAFVVEEAGVRRRAMDRKLRGVEVLPEAEASTLLELTAAPAALIEEVPEAAE